MKYLRKSTKESYNCFTKKLCVKHLLPKWPMRRFRYTWAVLGDFFFFLFKYTRLPPKT